MKKSISIILFLQLSFTLFSQSNEQRVAFYDALFLKNITEQNGGKFQYTPDTKEVIDYYFGANTSQVTTNINNNSFIKPYFLPPTEASSNNVLQKMNGIKSFASGITSIGGLNVTKYANAIADLMIDRSKEELTIAFFNRFKKFSEENPEFKILFPQTTDNLANLLTYAYPQMLPALRNGFLEDIKQITYRLDDVLDLPRYRNLLRDFPEIRVMVRSIRIVHELETGASSAADIIKEFSEFNEWSEENNIEMLNAGSCLKVASLFSESIRADSRLVKNEVWVTAKDVKLLFTDSILFNIYLGLIYERSKNIKFYKSDSTQIAFSELLFLEKQKGDLFLIQTKIKEYFDLAANVNTSFKDLQSKIKKDESPSNEDVFNYINTSIDAIEYGFSIMKVFHLDNNNFAPENYLAVARKSNELYKSIYSKQYTQAINNAFDIFNKLNNIIKTKIPIDSIKVSASVKSYSGIAKDEVKRLKEGETLIRKITGEKIDSVANIKTNDKDIKQLVQYRGMEYFIAFLEKVKPYALFMANMVEADSEDEVKAALNNVILPVGSSTVKKYAKDWGNISVQSYLGAYYSFTSSSTSVQNSWNDKWGVIAPIGISWTPGFLSWGKVGSVSMFVSFIDLGAIVDYKLQKDSTITENGIKQVGISKDYKVELGQIFSPGGYLIYGFFGNLPLSLGFGAQYGPGLSKIDAGGNTVISNPSWRWNAYLALDIPFFNIMNKNKVKPTR